MASEYLIDDGEDWNDIFVARDFNGNEDQPSEEDSDSDPDYIGEDTETQSDIEDEPNIGPAIGVQNTQILRDGLQGKSFLTPVKYVLTVMDALGINVPIFLDALSWGDAECIQDAKIRYARSALMNSEELPGILRWWWKPPRSATSKKKHPKGARHVMEAFAADCVQNVLDRELEAISASLLSPTGEDIKEETFTSLIFDQMISSMKTDAPTLWKLLRGMAYTQKQQKVNTEKNPDKVRLNRNSL
jgi:hypothetical protein